MRQLNKSFFLFSVVFLVSCTQLGLEKPDTTPQRFAYAITAITNIREQTVQLLSNKRIEVQDARKVQDLADIARLGIEKAIDLYFSKTNSDKPGALRMLESAEMAIMEATDFIQKVQKRP